MAFAVESFWISEVARDVDKRVLPDGCLDLVLVLKAGRVLGVNLVGLMTRPHCFALYAGQTLVGIRFRPGLSGMVLACPAAELVDRSVPLPTVAPGPAWALLRAVQRAGRHPETQVEALQETLRGVTRRTALPQALRSLTDGAEPLSLDALKAAANLGERQLRRVCRAGSGVSPKRLTLILRFRAAALALRQGRRDLSALAADCGYHDQAHLTRDFRRFAGVTPGAYARGLPE